MMTINDALTQADLKEITKFKWRYQAESIVGRNCALKLTFLRWLYVQGRIGGRP